MTSKLRDRWAAPWHALAVRPADSLREALLDCYGQPHRSYHTGQHLQECFGWFDRARSLCRRPAEVDLALWFHDAVYDPARADNEECSAAWAERELTAAGCGADTAERVRDLVLATRHGAIPDAPDARVLVDIDLAILAAEERRFAQYEEQVRREYQRVDDAAFARGRCRVLQGFLERPSVYLTDWFRVRLEQSARRNLELALARWSDRSASAE